MTDAVSEFWKVEQVVLDTCAGILATTWVCLQLPVHRQFVGCEKNPTFLQNAL